MMSLSPPPVPAFTAAHGHVLPHNHAHLAQQGGYGQRSFHPPSYNNYNNGNGGGSGRGGGANVGGRPRKASSSGGHGGQGSWGYSVPPAFSFGGHNGGGNGGGHGLKFTEMSPETTLVEFISTSASFHGVKKQKIAELEYDILKLFPNNIMPANAAAWYMAKRRFYMGQNGNENHLLPLLLKNYPKKFAVTGNSVEFLETYAKDVAKRKMAQMVRQGLHAYFAHKVEEYGVYFFDPGYYENTEPFVANLRQVTNQQSAHCSKLLPAYFSMHTKDFVYQVHRPYLVTISREPVDVRLDTTGIIVSMIDNQFGVIQFPSGTGTEKAFFSARSLIKDGYPYNGDPMKLQTVEFDGYRIPQNKPGEYAWYAVLVWSGPKPNPKYCATKEDLTSSPFFQNQSAGGGNGSYHGSVFDDAKKSRNTIASAATGCMQVGEVLSIRKDGAVVSMGKDSEEKALIPGWLHRNNRVKGNFLTTTQGVELAVNDLVTFYLNPGQTIKGYSAVGCNVTVLKHAQEKGNTGRTNSTSSVTQPQAGDFTVVEAAAAGGKKKRNKSRRERDAERKGRDRSDSSSSGNKGIKEKKADEKDKKQRSKKKSESAGSTKQEEETKKKQPVKRFNLREFLMADEIAEEDNYDSDRDPCYMPRPFDSDLDYDEYSDGEVPEDEQKELAEDLLTTPEEIRQKLEALIEAEQKEKEEAEKAAKEEAERDAKEKAEKAAEEESDDAKKPEQSDVAEKSEKTEEESAVDGAAATKKAGKKQRKNSKRISESGEEVTSGQGESASSAKEDSKDKEQKKDAEEPKIPPPSDKEEK